MTPNLDDLFALLAVARSGGFREAARGTGGSPSTLSESVRRLEKQLGVRLLNRSTRSIALTEAGTRLMERLTPALTEVEAAIDVVNQFRDRPVGWLRLNVPVAAVRLVLPSILPPFLAAYPDIRVEVTAQESLVDILAQGFDAGIRYEERLQKDMIAVPIGPRRQRAAVAASPAYLDKFGRPNHPRELLNHHCLRARFASGAMVPWEFELDGEVVRVEADGQLVTSIGETTQLAVEVATKGAGIVCLFEEWLQPYFDSGALEPVLKEWWPSFVGPYLYYPSRAYLPAPLRAFVDFVASQRDAG